MLRQSLLTFLPTADAFLPPPCDNPPPLTQFSSQSRKTLHSFPTRWAASPCRIGLTQNTQARGHPLCKIRWANRANMSSPLVALIALVASSLMATTMAFVVPTGRLLGSMPGVEQQKQERPLPRRLGMVVDDSMNTAVAGGPERSSSRIGFLRERGERSISACSLARKTSVSPVEGIQKTCPLTCLGCYTIIAIVGDVVVS